MKKIINNNIKIVDDMLSGYVKSHSDRVKFSEINKRIICRKNKKQFSKVPILIGNGSGHEPIAVGWVGEGMLDANIVGDIFSAPSGDLIFEGIKIFKDYSSILLLIVSWLGIVPTVPWLVVTISFCNSSGKVFKLSINSSILLLISNHSGDVMNGEMAIEMAEDENINAKCLIMYDDIASAPKGNEAQRRGGAGTTFVYKILGALSEKGADIQQLLSLGKEIVDNTRTLSVAISPGTSPITGEKIFTIEEDEIFIGMGVHGESGYGRQKIQPSKKIISFMLDKIFDDFNYKSGDIVIPFVNGSGSTTLMELLIIFNDLEEYLSKYNIQIFKPLINEYITTQDSGGFSISLLNSSEEMRKLWLEPSSVPYFHLWWIKKN